jgi:hypothetical protein
MLSVRNTSIMSRIVLKLAIEHMEEDEETSKAIPPWVELEYAVCKRTQHLKDILFGHPD